MNLKKISTDSLQKQHDSHYEWRNQEAEALREKGLSESDISSDPLIVNLSTTLDCIDRELRRREKIEEILYLKVYLPIYNLLHRM